MIIYLIKHKITSKGYVGKTKRALVERWNQHCFDAKKGSNIYFHRAIRKYGPEAFELEILGVAISVAELNLLEKLWIISLRTYDSVCGYNSTFGGDGAVFNSATRAKISRLHTGVPLSESHKKAMSLCRIGKPRLRSSVEKSAAGHRGKKRGPRTNEWKVQQSMRLKGRVPSKQECSKNSIAITLKWQDPEYRKKQLESRARKKVLL